MQDNFQSTDIIVHPDQAVNEDYYSTPIRSVDPDNGQPSAGAIVTDLSTGATGSPFTPPVEQGSPFGEATVSAEDMTNEAVATPSRSFTMALALTNPDNVADPFGLIAQVQQNLQIGRDIIEAQGERSEAYRMAMEQLIRRNRALGAMTMPDPAVDPELAEEVARTTQINVEEDLERQARIALEDEAIQNALLLFRAGRTEEFRMAVNQLRPDRASVAGVLRENALKALVLQNALERANLDVEEEGFFNSFLTTVLSVPEYILLGQVWERLGNMTPGVGGYDPSFWRFFTSGTELGNQIRAWHNMTAADQAEELPRLLNNIRYNSDIAWLFRDPGRVRHILSQFQDGISEEMQRSGDVWSWVDMAFLFPWMRAGRSVRMLTTLGARRQAAENVAAAINTTVREGAESAASTTATTADEIIENALPTGINPLAAPDIPNPNPANGIPTVRVSISGDVSETYAQAARIAEELRPLTSSGRLEPNELREAIEAAANRVATRTGEEIADVVPRQVDLPNGTAVNAVSVTLRRMFPTAQEAYNFARVNGFDTQFVRVIADEPATRVRTPIDEGYTFRVYHGTPNEIQGALAESSSGTLGRGIYTTPNPELAGFYSRDGRAFFADIPGRPPMQPNVVPLQVKPEEMFGLDMVGGWTHDEVRAAFRELGIKGANRTAIRDELLERYADGLVPSEHAVAALARAVPAPKSFIGPDIEALNLRLAKKGYRGIAVQFADDVEVLLFDAKAAKSALERNIVQDPSGGFFLRFDMDVAETGFYTNTLNPPPQSMFSRYWKNPSQTSDKRLFEQQTAAGQRRQRMLTVMRSQWLSQFNRLNRSDREYLKQVLVKADNMGKWFTDREFNVIWERATGKPASEVARKAYQQYRVNNDIEHILRDADLYAIKQTRGYESVRFRALNQDIDLDAIISYAPAKAPNRRVYNVSDDIHYTKKDPLTTERMNQLSDNGYVLIKTEKSVKLGDGVTVDHFMVRKADIEIRPLRRQQLQYRPGGHRLYAHKYFVKQAQRGTQPDTGEVFLDNPNVFVTAPNIAQARKWAAVMDRARLAVKDGATAQQLDETIFSVNTTGLRFPDGESFIDDITSGRINKDEPFEAVFDREVPSAYKGGGEDVTRFLDEEEIGFNGYYRSTGQMYYSAKGDKLRDITGDWAPTLDPFEAQSRALHNVSQLSSFNDFKTSAIERWTNTYRTMLTNVADSPTETFNTALIDRSVRGSLRAQIEGQRASIKRVLGFESEFDRFYRDWMRSTSEWIVGDSDNKFRNWAATKVFNLQERNPVEFLRTVAFDMKLGLFNPRQLFVQTSTIASAIALSPRAGLKGWASIIPMRTYLLSQGSENVLDVLAKRGVDKLLGFRNADEFKEYARHLRDSGFFDIGNTHSLINDQGPVSTFSALSRVEAFREKSRLFFYEAEIYNRLVGFRIAYEDAIKQFGTRDWNNRQFREFIAGRSENYTFNMARESKSAWQRGILSVPTQFWAYNVRMLEALIGKDFSTPQKLRLLLMQMGLAGTGGIPIAAAVADYLNNEAGNAPHISSMWGTFQRGMFDRIAYEMFGADVQIGQAWGTGDFWTEIVKNVFGQSAYGPTSFADLAGGATYSIFGEVLGSALQVAHFWGAHESGGEPVDLTEDEWLSLFRQISTVNNITKAMLAHQYGIYQSTSGNISMSNLPPSDAIFIALGFAPGELIDSSAYQAYRQDRQQAINDVASQANALLMEAMNRPELFEENARKVNALINMAPVEMRRDIQRRIQATRDPSIYDRLLRQRERQELMDTITMNGEEILNGSAN